MEVRPGYKLTEVGVIPDDWEVKSIGDLGQINTGPFGTLLKAEEYSSTEGVPLISVGEVGSGTFKVTEDTPLVPDVVIRRLPQYVLRSGDIVFGRKGAVDRSALVSEKEDGWFLGSDGISLRPLRKCYPPYLAWQFQRNEVQAWLLQNAIGTTMPSLNQEILNRVKIPYAPIPEQRAIVAVLSDANSLLSSQNKLIAKKRDIKQAAMQQLLTGQTRLPGFQNKWQVKPITQVSWFQEGPGVRNTQFTNSGVKLLNGTNIFRGKINLETTERFISEKEAFGQYAHFLAECGDIVIASSGVTIEKFHEKVAFVEKHHIPLCMNTSTIRFKPFKDSLDTAFLFQVLMSDVFKRQIGAQATGSAQLNFGPSHIAKVEIPLPELSEQTVIAKVLSDMDAEIVTLEQRLAKTRDLKQGMMQELLTGRIRLV